LVVRPHPFMRRIPSQEYHMSCSIVSKSFLALALALIACREIYADDRASMPFPVETQGTFEADVALLANVLIAKIENPAPPDFVHDKVVGHELGGIFELIRDWRDDR